MTIVLEVADTLKNSSSLKELLCLILLLGNFMNASSIQGGAFGMRISSINKLADTKASNISSMSLLNVLAGVTRREFPHILTFLDDLKNASQAARIMASFNDMSQQYAEMRMSLRQLEVELGSKWQGEGVQLEEGDRFLAVMNEHREAAANRFEDLQTLYLNMDAKWKSVMVFYGENPAVMRPDDFFSTFSEFVKNWKEASIQEEKYTQRMEREEKKKREDEEHKARMEAKKEAKRLAENTDGKVDTPQRVEGVDISEEATTGTEDDRKMMDNLLAKLRTGESEVRTRHARRAGRSREVQDNSDVMPALRPSTSTQPGALSAEALLRSLQA
ncbi:hypothetical protein PHYBLDRAFT_158061, partial [Phycomyces blakesleeanus NRRL 1555(-)]